MIKPWKIRCGACSEHGDSAVHPQSPRSETFEFLQNHVRAYGSAGAFKCIEEEEIIPVPEMLRHRGIDPWSLREMGGMHDSINDLKPADIRRLSEEAERRKRECLAEWCRQERERSDMEADKRRQEAETKREDEARKSKRREEVKSFLRANGFHGVNEPASSLLGSTYPLHSAAAKANTQMVLLLLDAGAVASQKDYWGRTAVDIATSKDRNGSHAHVLRILNESQAAERTLVVRHMSL